jgi:hypothetical protein
VDAQHTGARASTLSSVARLVNPAQETNTSFGELFEGVSKIEQPNSIQYMGVMLTPGGFFDATAIYRTHNENADAVSTLGSIRFSGTPNARQSEVRGTDERHDFRSSPKPASRAGRHRGISRWT